MNLQSLVKACIEYKNAGGNLNFSDFYNSLVRETVNEYREQLINLFKDKTFFLSGGVGSNVYIEMKDADESVEALYKLNNTIKCLDKFPTEKLFDAVEIETVTPVPGGIICDVFVIKIPLLQFKKFVEKYSLKVFRSPREQISLIKEQLDFIESFPVWK